MNILYLKEMAWAIFAGAGSKGYMPNSYWLHHRAPIQILPSYFLLDPPAQPGRPDMAPFLFPLALETGMMLAWDSVGNPCDPR